MSPATRSNGRKMSKDPIINVIARMTVELLTTSVVDENIRSSPSSDLSTLFVKLLNLSRFLGPTFNEKDSTNEMSEKQNFKERIKITLFRILLVL